MRDLRNVLHEFWSGFYDRRGNEPVGIPAFMRGYAISRDDKGRIASNPSFPYITYEVVRPSFGDFTICTAYIWDKNPDNPGFTGLVDDVLAQIAQKIPLEGILLDTTDGFIKLSPANPFQDYMNDPDITVVRGVVRYVVRSYLY
ncbi:MAG: hypothetical protein FWE24_09125 [Defluviitaleaceae bacterium]|nr:hypothetical protein [Defluviitaleaceae bacterium]